MPEWVPAALEGVSPLEYAAVVVATVFGLWALWKALGWVFKKFFPGVVASANAVVNGAKIFAAVNGLPEFMAETSSTLAEHGATLQAQNVRIEEIHKETQTNGGSTLRDVSVRTERVINDEILPRLQALTDDNAQLRQDFEDTQASEIHLTVSPKATVTDES